MRRPVTVRLMLIFATVLALSYVLPVAYRPVVLDADGDPAGWLTQALQPRDAVVVRDYVHFWEDLPVWTVIVFAAPLALAVWRWRDPSAQVGTALRVATPVLGAAALALLVGMVTAADFEILPFDRTELAYGAWVALAALTLFCAAALLGVRPARSRPGPAPDPRRSGTAG